MTAPMTIDFAGLAGLDGHHQDMEYCAQKGDRECKAAIESQVKLYITQAPPGTPASLMDSWNCYYRDTCNPSEQVANIIKATPEGVQSANLQTLMNGYIQAGSFTGKDVSGGDPAVEAQFDQYKQTTCDAASKLGVQLPGCAPVTGGTTVATTGPVETKSETNWLLYGGIALGALALLGGAALFARKRSAVHGLRGLGCGSFGCGSFGGLGRFQPWNARAAERYNRHQYPCR